MHKLCQILPVPRNGYPFLGEPTDGPHRLADMTLLFKWGTSSQILSPLQTHILLSPGLVTFVTKQPSIRCNRMDNIHWVHPKCAHITQRQYTPDWRCNIHTHTLNSQYQTSLTQQKDKTLSYFNSTQTALEPKSSN